MPAAAEMPRYKCHKEVSALKIKSIEHDFDVAQREGRETDGKIILTSEDPGCAPVKVDMEWFEKHGPEVGGYFVAYLDGYTSYSPAAAFESGYTRI